MLRRVSHVVSSHFSRIRVSCDTHREWLRAKCETGPALITLSRGLKGRSNAGSFRQDLSKGVDPPGQLKLIHTGLIIIPASHARLRATGARQSMSNGESLAACFGHNGAGSHRDLVRFPRRTILGIHCAITINAISLPRFVTRR